ncbi:MAG: HDOD domain-containing protein [Puniceicoccaceae bacterium]
MTKLTIAEICEKAKEMPCCPSILPQVMELLNRDDAGIMDLEDVILRDQALAAAVLKMANSAYFSGGRSFDNLSDAILRLGFRQTYRLTVTVSSGRWSSLDISAYGWQPGDFCRHSFAVAVASRLIAEKTGAADADLAYTAGLMHDAGKLALAYAAGDVLTQVREYQKEMVCDWISAEKEVLGFSHEDISASLLASWGFPEILIEVGKNYASPANVDAEFKGLVSVVHAGKHLAIQTGVGAGEDAFWTPLDQESIRILNLKESELQDLMPGLVDVLTKLLRKEIFTGAIRFE